MENATKALLISAGVILAVIVFGLVFYTYQQISNYYQTKESNLTIEQLAEINNEFSVYQRDITGFELVSLINKAIDFNQTKVYGVSRTTAEQEEREAEGYAPMSVKVTITNLPNQKLFKNGDVIYNGNNENRKNKELFLKINEMQTLESKINPGDLAKLTSHTSEFEGQPSEKLKQMIKEYTGREYDIDLQIIKEYEDYLSFKRGTFECIDMRKSNEQINSFTFKQIK